MTIVFPEKGAAFMPYVCCGDPSADFTRRLVKTLAECGADAIELGIPFSDPIADGRSIQAASARALAGGMSPMKALEALKTMRKEGLRIPVIIMTYYNIVLANGGERFVRAAREAGADGLIVPDVPLEESGPLQETCREAQIPLIRLVSISSGDERLGAIMGNAEGFVYAVAALGTTGAREGIDERGAALVRKAAGMTGLPVAVGFGISRPEHAAAMVRSGARGVIVGSAIADIYSKHISGKDGSGGMTIDGENALRELREYARGMKKACLSGI